MKSYHRELNLGFESGTLPPVPPNKKNVSWRTLDWIQIPHTCVGSVETCFGFFFWTIHCHKFGAGIPFQLWIYMNVFTQSKLSTLLSVESGVETEWPLVRGSDAPLTAKTKAYTVSTKQSTQLNCWKVFVLTSYSCLTVWVFQVSVLLWHTATLISRFSILCAANAIAYYTWI